MLWTLMESIVVRRKKSIKEKMLTIPLTFATFYVDRMDAAAVHSTFQMMSPLLSDFVR